MPLERADLAAFGGSWETIQALDRNGGSSAHAMVRRLSTASVPMRDLADSAHFLCILHGRLPGMIDLAGDHITTADAVDWLNQAATAFVQERSFMAAVSAAAGPPPSTPGHAESEAAVAAQCHALDMLAQSDRKGCAIGAVVALVLEWPAIRGILDNAANRLSMASPTRSLPSEKDTALLVNTVAQSLPIERAMLFGARQLLIQHSGLWDLLETRMGARERA
ncbi:hypothetical protein GCM10023219_23500 [Stakelama sediminis]|uniref:Uncharacterized protein n=1 Tax=Stakelama sediminis TaxID=463200 RepID=A0A840YZQ5_9SPHN|nr:hypothetical protein [Stakelama sediminis]MBB5718972.1 hypothetical protein [Stakelama sediminis]